MLTAIKLAKPPSVAFFARDADALNKTVQFTVTLNQTAWLVAHRQRRRGNRTVKSDASTPAGIVSFVWDGKASTGTWAPDGYYRSVVTATTSLGSYTQQRSTHARLPDHSFSDVSGTRRQGDADDPQH